MVNNVEDKGLDDEHPLSLEISSLKSALSRFQDEAYNSSVKLQRFSYDTSTLNDRLLQVERENEILRQEINILRANPHPDSSPQAHPAVAQSQQLTLSLRRLSDKLSLTEETLLERTTELAHAHNETAKLQAALQATSVLAEQERDRDEQHNIIVRDLERKIWESGEREKMSDLVVNEYAALVRSLEGRASTNSSRSQSNEYKTPYPLAETLSEGKLGLHKLFAEFSEETEKLEAEIHRLQGALAESEARCDAENQVAATDRVLLAKAQHELDKLRNEDKSAAQMVSRYMKFSQSSNATLQESLSTLKTRHAATVDTLSEQLSALHIQLQTSQVTSEKLRSTLDELGKDILRESFGRRREIALRLHLVTREEIMFEGLRRWVRRAQESLDGDHDTQLHALRAMLTDAEALLNILDGSEPGVGSSARIIAAETTVKSLNEELQREISRRLELEKSYELYNSSSVICDSVLEVEGSQLPASKAPDQSASTHDVPATSLQKEQPSLPSDSILDQAQETTVAPIPIPNIPEAGVVDNVLTDRSSPEVDINADTETLDDSIETVFEPVQASAASELPHVNSPSSVAFPQVTDEKGTELQPSPEKEDIRHPLLDDLVKVSHRYDDIQRAFRDCHLALQDLKQSILTSSPSGSDLPSSQMINGFPVQLFQTALDRLDDVNEDCRVSLEIQIADEALRIQGFEAMLSIPNAISSSASQTDAPTLSEVESQIYAFISGVDPSVHRAQQSLSHKLNDIQNDIAVLKRAIYDPDLSPSGESFPTTPAGDVGGGGWTSWIRSPPSRPISPAPAPTFGNVMTSPRLRHASSFHNGSIHGKKASTSEDFSTVSSGDKFANLGLKVAMPSLKPSVSAPGSVQCGPRARTVSTMYTLGLGSSRSSSAVFSSSGTSSPQQARTASVTLPSTTWSMGKEQKEESDVE